MWEEVKYCSDRCRNSRGRTTDEGASARRSPVSDGPSHRRLDGATRLGRMDTSRRAVLTGGLSAAVIAVREWSSILPYTYVYKNVLSALAPHWMAQYNPTPCDSMRCYVVPVGPHDIGTLSILPHACPTSCFLLPGLPSLFSPSTSASTPRGSRFCACRQRWRRLPPCGPSPG